jgi:hypothetical protein
MLNVTIHLGSPTPFSSRTGPRAPARHSTPAPFSLPPGPTHQCPARLCPNSDAPPMRAAFGSRLVGTRSRRRLPVGARPHDCPRATWHPHGRTPPLSPPFPLSAAPPIEPFEHNRTSRPLSRHQLLSGPPLKHRLPLHCFPCPYRCLRPPEASPSRRILPSAAAVFPLSGEHSLSFAIPKLELTLSSPFHTSAAGPPTRRRRPSELPPRRRTPLS